MRAGLLRHLVWIETATESQSASGETSYTWERERSWRVSITPLQGRERFEAQQVRPEVTHRVIGRYVPGLTTKQRLDMNGRKLNIAEILNPGERNVSLELLCAEEL